jgi:hypothetical protein
MECPLCWTIRKCSFQALTSEKRTLAVEIGSTDINYREPSPAGLRMTAFAKLANSAMQSLTALVRSSFGRLWLKPFVGPAHREFGDPRQ